MREVTAARTSEPQGAYDPHPPAAIALARAAVIASGPLPRWLVRAGFYWLIRVLGRRHPEAFRRLSEMAPADLLIDPVDLPQAFVLSVGSPLRIGLADRNTSAQAAIRGRFPALLELVYGWIDGDALFFGRQLAM